MNINSIFAVIATLLLQAYADTILNSTRITNWGVWGEWERCPNGTYATAAQIKYEEYEDGIRRGDRTALNGIKLFCNAPGQYLNDHYITSLIGSFGEWKHNIFECRPGIINGFQLRSLHWVGSGTQNDDMAATNVKIFCHGSNAQAEWDGIVLGPEIQFGEYTEQQICPQGEAVCGIRTQVQLALDFGSRLDDSSLNNVDMECCKLLSPTQSCSPSDLEEIIMDCDNLEASSSTRCSYSWKTGVWRTNGENESPSWTNDITTGLGSKMSSEYEFLKTIFKSSLSKSNTTGYEWKIESSKSFSGEITRSFSFEVPAGKRTTMSQVIGMCGNYKVLASKLIRRDYDKTNTTTIGSYYMSTRPGNGQYPINSTAVNHVTTN